MMLAKEWDFTKETFIDTCQQSSESAYLAFQQLSDALLSENTRASALALIDALKKSHQSYSLETHHFRLFQQTLLTFDDESHPFWFFQFPSTFEPEAWSFTFYEGLARYPVADFHHKSLVELGCGIGWISIAVALRFLPTAMIGVDINPKAVQCAKLNALINHFDEHGNPIVLADGQTLFDRLSFHPSDLLHHFDGHKESFDYIIGCIPQVLNPEPETMQTIVADSSSDDYLLSLSNYCAVQGYIEDQFGLGLIAKAVEQSIPLLYNSGKLILNLGGRPGQAVLERLMERRGFSTRKVWHTYVKQAADTDITELVNIEETVGHKFEFFVSPNSTTPIPAKTAEKLLQSQRPIYHTVDVYEAKMCYPQLVKTIFESVNYENNKKLSSAIDLSFNKQSIAEERFSFIAYLTQWLKETDAFPYELTQGLLHFRQQVVEYLRYYHQVHTDESYVLVTPGRKELYSNLLNTFSLKNIVVDYDTKLLINSANTPLPSSIYESPNDIDTLMSIVEAVNPELIITTLKPEEINSIHLIEQLIDAAEKNNALLVMDISNHVSLSSDTKSHAVYRWLANHTFPPHVMLSISLIQNEVYDDLSLNIAITHNHSIIRSLMDAAELTYSRTPVLTQLYYAHILEELLYFQRTRLVDAHPPEVPNGFSLSLSESSEKAFCHPAITGNHYTITEQIIRMDYGENELPAPEELKNSILESFLISQISEEESSPENAIRTLLSRRFGIPKSWYAEMAYGNGVAPIYSSLLALCKNKDATMTFSTGAYGYFVAAADFHQVNYQLIHTDVTDQFKLTAKQLTDHLDQNPTSWVFLNAPVVNPTGALYHSDELNDLLSVAANYPCTIILDCIFSGLEFQQASQWNLKSGVEAIVNSANCRLAIISGVAKEFAAGGLRFGYCWSTHADIIEGLHSHALRVPHKTLGYAVRETIEAQLDPSSELHQHLSEQKRTLERRATILDEILTEKGWDVIKPQAGLFLVAKPPVETDSAESVYTNVNQAVVELFEQAGLLINNATWTGLPGYCRFVLSIPDDQFNEAIARIEQLN